MITKVACQSRRSAQIHITSYIHQIGRHLRTKHALPCPQASRLATCSSSKIHITHHSIAARFPVTNEIFAVSTGPCRHGSSEDPGHKQPPGRCPIRTLATMQTACLLPPEQHRRRPSTLEAVARHAVGRSPSGQISLLPPVPYNTLLVRKAPMKHL